MISLRCGGREGVYDGCEGAGISWGEKVMPLLTGGSAMDAEGPRMLATLEQACRFRIRGEESFDDEFR